MPKYNSKYLDAVRAKDATVDPDCFARYEIDVDPDWGEPPLLEVARVLTEIPKNGGWDLPVELQDKILRYSVVGRMVKISYDGRLLGAFQMNDLREPFENHPVLKNNPGVLPLLMKLALYRLREKSMPPMPKDPTAAAQQTPGSNASSAQ
jgi:hypothetical protein